MQTLGADAQEAGLMNLRSMLFVPGDSERKLAKVAGSQADALILDLEDAVAPDREQFYASYDPITVTFDRVVKAESREELVLRDAIFGWQKAWPQLLFERHGILKSADSKNYGGCFGVLFGHWPVAILSIGAARTVSPAHPCS